MNKNQHTENAPFCSIREASMRTGLSIGYLRTGCQTGNVPHIKVGKNYLVNIPALLKKLNAEE